MKNRVLLLPRLAWVCTAISALAASGPPAVCAEEAGLPAAVPRKSSVPDADLTGYPAEPSPPPDAATQAPTAAAIPVPGANGGGVIGANPLFGVRDGAEQVAFPDVPLPLGPTEGENQWRPEGAHFPSGTDMLHLMSPEASLLDPTHAEISPRDTAEAAQVSDALVQLGLKIAPAVLTLRAWDEFGAELASGSGFFVNDTGLILTDMALVHPEISGEIDYISAMTGDGKGYRVTGVRDRDSVTGTALLQTDGRRTPFLKLNTGHAFPGNERVTILAVHETRGLILADAVVSRDEKISGEGWLIVRGQDSPGAVGSPVLDANGDVVAVIAMQLPLRDWVNFAVPVREAAGRLNGQSGEPIPLSKLAGGRAAVDLAGNRSFQAAYADLHAGRYKQAAVTLVKLTKGYPRSAECWGLLGLASAKLGAWGEALDCQRRAVALDPSLDESWYQLALASLKDEGGLDVSPEARESLENTVQARPGDRFAWLLLAQSHILAEDYESADASLQQVIRLEPDYAQAHYLLGFVRGRLGDFDMAEAAMRRSLQLDSRNGKGWFYLGLLYTKLGRPGDAANAFRVVVQLDPEHPHAWLNLARLLLDEGKRTEARAAFRRHQEVDAGSGG